MRFVFILPNLAGGGAEKAVLKTALALQGRGNEVHVLLLEQRIDYRPPELQIHVLAARLARGWLGKRLMAWRLRRQVMALAPDIVISSLPFADEVAVLANLPQHWCRIANTLSVEVSRLRQRDPAKAERRLLRYRRLYGQRPLIAVSSGVARDLRETLELKTVIKTIPNPFDFAAIREAAAQTAALPVAPFVIHVGRFSAQKRHDVLLDAWAQLKLPHQLVLLTQADPKLEQMIAERGLVGRVTIAGFQKNPYPWMAAADLLVLSSDHEGLPNVLIEALICGTPVVSTDCPSGPREILGQALPDALVPCGDATALAQAVQRSLLSPPDLALLDLSAYAAERAAEAYENLVRRCG